MSGTCVDLHSRQQGEGCPLSSQRTQKPSLPQSARFSFSSPLSLLFNPKSCLCGQAATWQLCRILILQKERVSSQRTRRENSVEPQNWIHHERNLKHTKLYNKPDLQLWQKLHLPIHKSKLHWHTNLHTHWHTHFARLCDNKILWNLAVDLPCPRLYLWNPCYSTHALNARNSSYSTLDVSNNVFCTDFHILQFTIFPILLWCLPWWMVIERHKTVSKKW